MSKMSAINVIYVLATYGMYEKNHSDAWENVPGKCRISRASVGCAQMSLGQAACVDVINVLRICITFYETTPVFI